MPFKSKKQAKMFYAKAKKSPVWKKRAEEFSEKTNWNTLPDIANNISRKGKKRG